mgnify:CR=1 FL=1
MTRTPINERTLPGYTRAEETANMITHIIGGVLGIAVLAAALAIATARGDVWAIASGGVYGVSMTVLYAVSSVYHGLSACSSERAKKVMQAIDHCTIYLLISGTYTPILLVAMRPEYPQLSWILFAAEWTVSAVAAVFTAIDHKRFAALSMVCYILLGWLIVFTLRPAVETIGEAGFLWLLAGGVSYTLGAALYIAGRKKSVLHPVFHCFVLLGSALQAVCVLRFVL